MELRKEIGPRTARRLERIARRSIRPGIRFVKRMSIDPLLDPRLTDGARKTLGVLIARGGKQRVVRLTQRQMAEDLPCTIKTIQNHYRALEAAGYIARSARDEFGRVAVRLNPLCYRPVDNLWTKRGKRRRKNRSGRSEHNNLELANPDSSLLSEKIDNSPHKGRELSSSSQKVEDFVGLSRPAVQNPAPMDGARTMRVEVERTVVGLPGGSLAERVHPGIPAAREFSPDLEAHLAAIRAGLAVAGMKDFPKR